MSLPNMVDLTVSTPVKNEPQVKNEPTSMANTPRSLPVDQTDQPTSTMVVLTNAANVSLGNTTSSTTRSVTLGTESLSPDTTLSNMENTPPPTSSPPAKVRRCTRLSMKES